MFDDYEYKIKEFNRILDIMASDEYAIPKVSIYGETKNISLDEDAIKALIAYYSGKNIESSCRPVKSGKQQWEIYFSEDNEYEYYKLTDDFDEARFYKMDGFKVLPHKDEDDEITNACHGKSKKPAKKKTVKSSKKVSKFNTFSSLFIKQDVIKKGKYGIELDLNGWKIINVNGKPAGGEPAEFASESEAKSSQMYQDLALRYGEDKVRTYKQ